MKNAASFAIRILTAIAIAAVVAFRLPRRHIANSEASNEPDAHR